MHYHSFIIFLELAERRAMNWLQWLLLSNTIGCDGNSASIISWQQRDPMIRGKLQLKVVLCYHLTEHIYIR
jgi:hypothetical protein